MTTLKDFCAVEYGKGLPERARQSGDVKVVSSAGVVGSHNEAMYNEPIIVVGRKGNISGVHKIDGPSWVIDTAYAIKAHPSVDRDFLFYFLKFNTAHLAASDQSTAIPSLARDVIYNLPFAPPNLKIQRETVARIESIFLKVDEVEESLSQSLERAGLLRLSVLKEAFKTLIQ